MTGYSAFSMFNLSLKEEWVNNKKFCHRMSDDEDQEEPAATQEAKDRLEATKSRQSSPNGSVSEEPGKNGTTAMAPTAKA